MEREEELFKVLFGHWKDTPNLAAKGFALDFSAMNTEENTQDADADDVDQDQGLDSNGDDSHLQEYIPQYGMKVNWTGTGTGTYMLKLNKIKFNEE